MVKSPGVKKPNTVIDPTAVETLFPVSATVVAGAVVPTDVVDATPVIAWA